MLDLFRGQLSPRKVWLLATQLPAGSRLGREMGGQGAWSPMEQAIHAEVWQVRQMLAGERIPRPEPPQPGWREDAAKKQAEVDRRMARYTG